jgi:hypothetical protein
LGDFTFPGTFNWNGTIIADRDEKNMMEALASDIFRASIPPPHNQGGAHPDVQRSVGDPA